MQIETTQLKIQHSTRIIYIKGSVSLFYTRPGGGGGGGGGRSSSEAAKATTTSVAASAGT